MRILVPLFTCLISATACYGQTGVGRIQGTVRDTSGAVVPGVEVSVVQVTTQSKSRTRSNESGVFVIPALPSGQYQVSATSAGLSNYNALLELAVGQTADLQIVLSAAATQTSISVTAEVAQLVTAEAATVSSNLENQRLQQLPLNGRFLQNLLLNAVPGMEGNADRPKVFGMREGAMEFTLDGAVLSNRYNTFLAARPPGLDSISEVRVETSVPSAKLNRPATAILSTRSGGNEIRGTMFYTTRNNAIGVARRREQFTDAPQLIRNEFGATLGGPVVLPKIYNGRNKTFFFSAWEDFQLRQGSDRQSSIATMAMRQGDFSALRDAIGRPITIYDPQSTAGRAQNWARTPYPGNRIPALLQSPLSKHIYAQMPEPSFPDVNPSVAANFFRSYSARNDQRTFSFRGDHRINDSHTVFGRYSRGSTREFQPSAESAPAPVFLDNSANIDTQDTMNYSVVGNWAWVVSPTVFVETTANYSIFQLLSDRSHPSVGANLARTWGLPNPRNHNGVPDITNMGFGAAVNGPYPDDNRTSAWNVDQNFSKLAGKHQLEMGWHWRRDSVYVVPRQYPYQTEVAFNSNATAVYDPRTGNAMGALPQSGHDSANFFLGVAAQYLARINRPHYTIQTGEVAGFVQDNWRISKNLTLNLGLRWEYFSPFKEKDNNMVGFDVSSLSVVLGNPTSSLIAQGQTTAGLVKAYEALGAKFISPEQAGLPPGFINRDWWNFNPRIGAAYRTAMFGRTLVFRAGFGGYHFPIPTRTYHQPMRQNAPFDAAVLNSAIRADQSPDGLANYAMRSIPSIIAGKNSENAVTLDGAIPLNPGFTVHHMLPDMPTPVAYEWNFTAEYEFLPRTVARLGYTATAGRNQEQWEATNRQPTDYNWFVTTRQPLPTGRYAATARRPIDKFVQGEIRIYRPEAYNNFTGLRAEIERRFSRGLAMQWYYMMSHAMGTGWAPSNSGYSAPDEVVSEAAAFLPGAVPENYRDRVRFLTYKRDETIPHHRFNWNFVVDLPFGKGKAFANSQKRWVEWLAGGWQVAGLGSWNSRWFQLPDNNWGGTGTPEYYGTAHLIQDCRSGQCFHGYLYYNGYISNRVLNQPNGILGVPANYSPSHWPVNPAPAPGQTSNVPQNFWDTNQVTVPLANGTTVTTALNTFLHPWRTQIAPGPWNFGMNASLFKRIALTERLNLRLNFDAFNVFNMPGMQLPDPGTGIISLRNSNNTPRQLQFTGRLEW
jgi:hypothetical protein